MNKQKKRTWVIIAILAVLCIIMGIVRHERELPQTVPPADASVSDTADTE